MSRLRPSAAHRWVPCPGSAALEALYPEPESSFPALEGNTAHAVAADILKRYQAGEVPVNEDYLGKEMGGFGVVVTEDMVDGVNLYIREIARAIGGRKNIQHLHVEELVKIPLVSGDIEGTPDIWYFLPADNSLHLWDLKFGWGVVEAYYNWQLICYALGLFQTLTAAGVHPYRIVFHIVQPRAQHADGPVREWEINPTLLKGYAPRINASKESMELPNPPLKVGRHCADCKAAHTCPALGESVYTMLDYVGTSTAVELQGASLGAHLTRLRDLKILVDERLDSVEIQALEVIKQGVPVPGWVTSPKSSRRVWDVTTEEIKAMGELVGVVTVVDKPLTPTQAEKAGVDKDVVATLIKRVSGELKLLPQNPEKTADKVFGSS